MVKTGDANLTAHRKVAAHSAKTTEELVVLANDEFVHLDLTAVAELKSEVRVVGIVVPAALSVSVVFHWRILVATHPELVMAAIY